MTRSEFINDLRARIWNLPVEEVSAAIRYYDNFIANAGIENEKVVLENIGSPQIIAENIKREYKANSQNPTRDYSKTNPAKDMVFGTEGNNNNFNQNSGNTNYYNYGNNNQNHNPYGQRQYSGYHGRRLFKSETDRMICGVCGGVAEYFDMDPSLVRIITVFVAFTGAGLLAYLVAAAILPDKSRL